MTAEEALAFWSLPAAERRAMAARAGFLGEPIPRREPCNVLWESGIENHYVLPQFDLRHLAAA